MTVQAELSKLAELRAKTDRELARVICNALEVGMQCASAAMNMPGPLRDKADHIYADVLTLVPKIENIAERRRLESKLKGMRELLDRSAAVHASAS